MRPRILVCSYECPVPAHGGYRLRVLHLARLLAQTGAVTVAALGDVPDHHDEPFALVGIPPFSRISIKLLTKPEPSTLKEIR